MTQHGYRREFDEDLDRGEDRDRWRGEDRERGFMLGGDDRSREEGRFAGPYRSGGDWKRVPRDFSGRQDDYYRSWRYKQMEELDRDYAEYRRERERQFHEDFDAWRRSRRGNPEPLQAGMTQTGLSSDPSGELQLTADEAVAPASGPDPMATATLGTSSSRSRR
jgi:hypothetical protein